MSWIIYCHTHTPTGRRYIGRTSRPLMVRWKEHAREARDGRGNLPLHTAILESGEASFKHEILESFGEADKSLALDAELRWIEHYQTTDPAKGFNRIGTGKKHEGHAMKFQDRVVGLVRLPGSRILPAPKNFRTHGASQRDAMRGVLADVGISGTAVVWVPDPIAQGDLLSIPRGDDDAFREWFKRYRGDFQLIDGHLRAEEIRDQGLPCVVLDVDEREAAELLATFDPIGALAGFDKARYVSLAADFNSTNSAVQQLVADMAQMEAKRKAEAESVAAEVSSGDGEPQEVRGDDGQAGDDDERATDSDDGQAGDEPRVVEVADLKAPFPWFGGKSRAAGIIWGALGDVKNYVEPFAGSLAVLLSRPGGPGKIETVNDLDAWVANFWRAVASDPEAVALAADWPVNEADLHSRHKWLLKQDAWRRKMLDDADHFDPKIAGWWVWGLCAWIGSGWCSMREGKPSEQVPHLSGVGQGIHGSRVSEKLPMLAHGARGVDASRMDGPSEKLPQFGNAGRGVNSASVQMPSEQLPHLITGSRGGHRVSLGEASVVGENIRALMIKLRDRLRRVRVACGSWERVLTPSVTTGHGLTGVVLDPPYAEGADDLYGNHDKSVSAKVKAWAVENGNDPEMRIAFCGYEGEHDAFPSDWRCIHWKAQGGYGSQENARRERIWLSPHCLKP